MKLPSIPYLGTAFLNVVRRFPLVMSAAAIGVATMMYLIENSDSGNEKDYVRIVLAAALGLTTFLCSTLVAEKYKLSGPKLLVTYFLGIGLVLLYYYSLTQDNFETAMTPIRFVGLNLAAHLGVAFLPYLDNSSVEDFWEYNKRLFGNFVVGAFYSGVIFAGLGIAIFAVDELFNLEIDGKIYGHLFVVLAGIFNTAYFLAHFPTEFTFSEETPDNQAVGTSITPYNSAFKNLTKFILIPIVAIYFLILYAFSAKILVQWELPEGWVGKLVLGFSVAGIFTYLLNYLLVKFDDSMFVKGFRRWFFYVLLPMVALLFVAIGRRISDYGVTEARYVVAIAGVWLFLTSVYFIISKRDNIKFIPVSLAFFALFTVLGPFSSFQVSERNQINRLMATLERNSMLNDGKAVPVADSLSKIDADNIAGSIDYLSQNHKFGKVASIFSMPDTLNQPTWEQKDSLLNMLGVRILLTESGFCNVNFNTVKAKGLNIEGYEKLYSLYLSTSTEKNSSAFVIASSGMAVRFEQEGMQQDSFDLRPFIAKLEAADVCGKDRNLTENDSLATYEIKSNNYEVKLVTENTHLKQDVKDWKIESWEGKILLRKKQ